jgi:hypothetical protein
METRFELVFTASASVERGSASDEDERERLAAQAMIDEESK